MEFPLNIGTDGLDIQTRVVLSNETRHSLEYPGKAGKVTLIGAFPTHDSNIYTVRSYPEYLNVYGLKDTNSDKQYDAHRAIGRLFMRGINGYRGATQVTCVNINTSYSATNSLTVESEAELDLKIAQQKAKVDIDKLLENRYTYEVSSYDAGLITTPSGQTPTQSDLDTIESEIDSLVEEITALINKKYLDAANFTTGTDSNTDEKQLSTKTSTLRTKSNSLGSGYALLYKSYNASQSPSGSETTEQKAISRRRTTQNKSATINRNNWSGDVDVLRVLENILRYTDETTGVVQIDAGTFLSFEKLKIALKKIAGEDTDLLFISSDLHDCVKGGKLGPEDEDYDATQASNLGQVYEELLNFINNEFSSHKPLTYVGHIRTSGTGGSSTITGLDSQLIKIDSGSKLNPASRETTYGVSYSDLNWGVKQITKLLATENNELNTCALFYQGGTINGEQVDAMELAAHMCGWIACGNVGEDLTYQTIPGLTSINEELFFGLGDAGTELNNCGVNVIRPKSRLDKTFYVNNSVNPCGWHVNHVRSVIYLLKQYAFESGLGINNITSNVVAFRASLENVSKKVMDEVDLIRDVQLGDIEIINNYHLYLPIDIILAGVVTKLSVGVSMTIDETGEAGSNQTTNGYNFYY